MLSANEFYSIVVVVFYFLKQWFLIQQLRKNYFTGSCERNNERRYLMKMKERNNEKLAGAVGLVQWFVFRAGREDVPRRF